MEAYIERHKQHIRPILGCVRVRTFAPLMSAYKHRIWYKLCAAVIFYRNLSLTVEVPEGVESINRAKYQTCNARLTTNIICALLTGFLQMCTGLMEKHLKFGSLEPIIWESQRKGN